MIRRFSAVLTVCLLLFSFSPELFAQIYPDREELDVVRLVDGTILKGVILEQVPDRYLEIELYGGSTFVLAYEQIEAVEREANPDYGTTWIKVDLGALDIGGETDGNSDRVSLRDGGVVLGGYFSAGIGYYNRGYWDVSWPGSGKMAANEETGAVFGWGFSVRVTGQPGRFTGTPWMLGFRGGGGSATRDGTGRTFGVSSIETDKVRINADTLHFPVELIFGPSGDRFALYGGFGPGVSVLLGGPKAETENYGKLDLPDEEYGYLFDTNRSISAIITASVTGVVRLGRSWEAELRIAYERLLIPWGNDSEMYHNAVDFTLGLGYRLGGRR